MANDPKLEQGQAPVLDNALTMGQTIEQQVLALQTTLAALIAQLKQLGVIP